jgi:hypothetical protein
MQRHGLKEIVLRGKLRSLIKNDKLDGVGENIAQTY